MAKKQIKKIFIEAYPITEPRISGIGHMVLEMIRSLEKHPDYTKKFELVLVVNKDREHTLKRWGFRSVAVKTIPLNTRLFNILWKFDLLPPMDIFLGRGDYIFFNYKNWRLWNSENFTYVCDLSFLIHPEFVSPKNQKFLERNIKKWVKRATKVITISENSKKEILRVLQLPLEKISVISCGVDTNLFKRPEEKRINDFLNEHNLPHNYILYLGNIEPRKNIENLIESYKKLTPNIRETHALLLVGGGGWLNERILGSIKKAQSEGYKIIHPATYFDEKDLPSLYAGASMLVHPAHYEGFGISPLQSMACGTPAIVANNSSLPEVVGNAALLVDQMSRESISAAMTKLISDRKLVSSLIEKGYQRVKKFSWSDSAASLLETVGI